MAKPSLLAAALALGAVGSRGGGAGRRRRRHAQEADRPRSAGARDGAGAARGAAAPARHRRPPRAGRAGAATRLKNYEEAATILLDVVEKYPSTRAHDDALVLLGESLFQARDFYSARHYLQEAVAKNTGSKSEQQALQRLVEISLRTGDFDHVDSLPHAPAESAAAADGAGHALRARQVLLLPQPARRRGAGVRVDPPDQSLLLPGAVFPRHDRGQEGRSGGRDPGLRRAPQDAGARRRRAKTSRT